MSTYSQLNDRAQPEGKNCCRQKKDQV